MSEKASDSRQLSLEEMLADPIVWMIMKSDQVDERELRELLKRVAEDLDKEGAAMSEAESVGSLGEYRRGVGIMLLNDQNKVFVGNRIDAQGDAWQMPQGGIDDDEEPFEAAFRELKEEIGTDKAQVIAESKSWFQYDLPLSFRKRWDNRWLGQRQKWFVMRFQGVDSDINIASGQPEFRGWKWISIEELPDLIIAFKRQLYLDLLHEFQGVAAVQNRSSSEKDTGAGIGSEGEAE